MSQNALEKQVGGTHYKDMPIQHAEFCQKNRMTWCESAAIKYLCRHRKKNGRQDVEKAIHYCELLLEIEYPATRPKPAEEQEVIITRDGNLFCAVLYKGTPAEVAAFGTTRSAALVDLASMLKNSGS